MSSTILMIRPVSFGFNEETAASNAFQQRDQVQQNVQANALKEFDAFVDKLRANDVDVLVIDDILQPHTPDSIFPNNWVSFHEDGKVFLYPMQAENRRLERRDDIIDKIRTYFNVAEVEDLSHHEQQNQFLEGTGSMVLDRQNKIAYACISPRTSVEVMDEFCKKEGYTPIYFHAVDGNGVAVYHTNVLMCMGENFVVICLDTVSDAVEKAALIDLFKQTNKEVIEISLSQMNDFAGNMLEVVNNKNEHLLVMSAKAYHSLLPNQIKTLENHCRIVYSDINTIETNGGGSARCMMAEVCLPSKK